MKKPFTLFIIGTLLLSTLSVFSPLVAALDYEWFEKNPLPKTQFAFGAATADDKIYVVGGQYWGSTYWEWTNTNYEYNPVDDIWSQMANMPTIRNTFATGSVNNKIYAIGGAAGPSGGTLSVNEEYDPLSDSWISKASMPTSRNWISAGVVQGKIYVFGGSDNSGNFVSRNEVYNPDTDIWAILQPSSNVRIAYGVGVVNDKIYVIGGHDSSRQSTNLVEEYDPQKDTWITLTSMPTARNALAVAVLDDKIYAIGGATDFNPWNNNLDIVEVYDPATDLWETAPSMPTPRSLLSADVVAGKIYAIGGFGDSGELNTHEMLDVVPSDSTSISQTKITNFKVNNQQLRSPNDYTCEPNKDVSITFILENTGSKILDLYVGLKVYSYFYNPQTAEEDFDLLYDSITSSDAQQITIDPGQTSSDITLKWVVPSTTDVRAYSVQTFVVDKNSFDKVYDSVVDLLIHVPYDNKGVGLGSAIIQWLPYPEPTPTEAVNPIVWWGVNLAYGKILEKGVLSFVGNVLGSAAFTFLTDCVTLVGNPNIAKINLINSVEGTANEKITVYEDQPIPMSIMFSPGDLQIVPLEIRIEKETSFLQRELLNSFAISGEYILPGIYMIHLRNPLSFSKEGTYYVNVVGCQEVSSFVPSEAKITVQPIDRLVILVESPVDLMVTSPDGHRIGYDTATETVVNEISGATLSGSDTEPQWITILNPLDGNYNIELIGTDSGDFHLTSRYTKSGNTKIEASSGTTSIGDTHSFFVNLSAGDLSLNTSSDSKNYWIYLIVGIIIASLIILLSVLLIKRIRK